MDARPGARSGSVRLEGFLRLRLCLSMRTRIPSSGCLHAGSANRCPTRSQTMGRGTVRFRRTIPPRSVHLLDPHSRVLPQRRSWGRLHPCLGTDRNRLVERKPDHVRVRPPVAARRHSGAGVLPDDHGAELRPDSRGPGCGRDQDRTRAGRRQNAKAARLCRRLLRRLQPEQAEPRGRPQIRCGPPGRPPPRGGRGRGRRKLCARHHGTLGLRLGGSAPDQSRTGVRRPQGVPLRTVREPPGLGRGRAVHGRPGLHDGAAGAAAAGRVVGDRHHGRDVRGDRDPLRPAGPRCHRPGPVRQVRTLRIDGVPDDPAYGGHRHHGARTEADAVQGAGVGDLRDVRNRRRGAGLHRNHQRQPLAVMVRPFRLGRRVRRSAQCHQRGPRGPGRQVGGQDCGNW